jgi:Bifunctional DNA primase/polymerase, N-terminal
MSDAPDNTPPGDPLAAKVVAARAAARKAAKAAWNAEPPFPIASDPGLWSKALNAAQHTETMLEAALALAQHGVPVFPVSPDDKKPLNAHGIYSATTDPAEVDRLWKRHPNALIGVPMGRRTGVFAIDATPHRLMLTMASAHGARWRRSTA